MSEFTEKHEQILQETHDATLKIQTVLLGTNGDAGLIGEVKQLSESHYKLRRHFWMLIAFLVGSGILASSIISVLNG